MNNTIYLPSRDLLGHALSEVMTEEDSEKRMGLFKILAERIKEHSDEVKVLMGDC